MQLGDAVEMVRAHDSYDEPETAYLAHGFMSFSRGDSAEWQIGYYDPETDTITSYHIQGGHVSRQPPSEVFKEKGSVDGLSLDHVLIPHDEAIAIAHDQLSSAYPQHPLMKTILLVQTIDDLPVYNFTLVTQTLHMYNVRVHAGTGDIVSERLEPLMNLRVDD